MKSASSARSQSTATAPSVIGVTTVTSRVSSSPSFASEYDDRARRRAASAHTRSRRERTIAESQDREPERVRGAVGACGAWGDGWNRDAFGTSGTSGTSGTVASRLDLFAPKRTAKIRQRPPRFEDDRLLLVDVVQEELSLAERRQQADRSASDRATLPVGARLRGHRGRAPCRARSAAGRASTCRRWRAPCSRDRPGFCVATTKPSPNARACFRIVSSGAFDGGFATGGRKPKISSK